MKKIQITDSLRKTKLNNEKRFQFADSIMQDVFRKRSDAIRVKVVKWQEKLVAETWGASPQARAANKKRAVKLRELIEDCRKRGVSVRTDYIGHTRSDLTLNMAGAALNPYFFESIATYALINFDQEFLADIGNRTRKSHELAAYSLTLKQGHKLIDEFEKLKHEADQLKEAGVEFRLMVDGVLKRSTTIGTALQNWPELEKYIDSIMSKSREIIVKPEDLTAKLNAIKSGVNIKDAMKSTGGDATRVKAK